MRKFFLTLLLSALTTLVVHAQSVSYNGVRQDVIIDVRTTEEFAAGHINGAVNIPLDRLDSGIQTIQGLRKDSRILLYCRSGQRSEAARKLLEKQGFQHVTNGGSISELQKNLKTTR